MKPVKFRVWEKEHNGIRFKMYQGNANSRAEAAIKSGKLHLVGQPSLTQALDQYKYGDEIIIQVYNESGSTTQRSRVNKNYDRIQVFFKRDVFIDICKQFLEDVNES